MSSNDDDYRGNWLIAAFNNFAAAAAAAQVYALRRSGATGWPVLYWDEAKKKKDCVSLCPDCASAVEECGCGWHCSSGEHHKCTNTGCPCWCHASEGREGKPQIMHKTHCRHGHLMSGSNLKLLPSGEHRCRECNRRTVAAFRARAVIAAAEQLQLEQQLAIDLAAILRPQG